jgi:ubiquinone biosynthesis protein
VQNILKTPGQIRRTIKNASRLRSILKVFVKYGFQDVVQKSNLSTYLPGKWGKSEINSFSTPQRMRMCFEELGPTFIKLGQLLASRPDIIPEAFVDEFKKLQDQVPALSFSQLEPVLAQQFPQGLENVFQSIDPNPLGAASIAQVHYGKLLNGDEVVLKIQRPGILKTIREDMNILFFVADLFDHYVPELRIFNPRGLVQEFSYAIEMETNFIVEANNVRRFYENFSDNKTVRIPKPYLEWSGRHVLVLEYFDGHRLNEINNVESKVDREQLMRSGLQAYFAMVFKDGLFHGDLHGGNVLVLADGKLGFIDFGMVGRLSKKTQSAIANMFLALATEDYDRLAYEYIELSTQSIDIDRDEFARDLRLILSPFFGMNLKSINVGKMLIDSAAVASKHNAYLPSELLLFFKSIVTIEGLGRSIKPDFDLLPYVYDFATEIAKMKYDPMSLAGDFSFFTREMSSLLRVLPGELKNYIRKSNNPRFAKQVEIAGLSEFQRVLANISYLLFFSVIVGSLVIAGAICSSIKGVPLYYGLPFVSWTFFSLATFFGLVAFYHYIRRS